MEQENRESANSPPKEQQPSAKQPQHHARIMGVRKVRKASKLRQERPELYQEAVTGEKPGEEGDRIIGAVWPESGDVGEEGDSPGLAARGAWPSAPSTGAPGSGEAGEGAGFGPGGP